MSRKKKHAEEHENLERWLVSYADFITLLFATFVVLYALSQIDLAKFKDFRSSLQKAFSHTPTILQGNEGVMDNKGQSMFEGNEEKNQVVPPILDAVAAKEEEKHYQLLQDKLKFEHIDEIKGVKTEVTERGIVITMVGNIFFDSSTSELRKESLETVKKIGLTIKENFPFNLIRIEGHTDNEQMNSAMFPSNWELSSYRASSVVRYLINAAGIDKNRFVAVGYADSRPVASNGTEEGKKANRRVEIVVLKSKLMAAELKTYSFQKERLERLEQIEKMYRKKEEEKKEKEKMSDAAKKLMEETGNSSNQIILYKDNYNKESDEIMNDLDTYEKRQDENARKKVFFEGVKTKLSH